MKIACEWARVLSPRTASSASRKCFAILAKPLLSKAPLLRLPTGWCSTSRTPANFAAAWRTCAEPPSSETYTAKCDTSGCANSWSRQRLSMSARVCVITTAAGDAIPPTPPPSGRGGGGGPAAATAAAVAAPCAVPPAAAFQTAETRPRCGAGPLSTSALSQHSLALRTYVRPTHARPVAGTERPSEKCAEVRQNCAAELRATVPPLLEWRCLCCSQSSQHSASECAPSAWSRRSPCGRSVSGRTSKPAHAASSGGGGGGGGGGDASDSATGGRRATGGGGGASAGSGGGEASSSAAVAAAAVGPRSSSMSGIVADAESMPIGAEVGVRHTKR